VKKLQLYSSLIDDGADINAKAPGFGSTLLYMAVRFSFNTMQCASIDIFDPSGATALTIALDIGDVKAAQVLLSRKANINTCHKVAPLCTAANSGHEKMIRFLLRKGAFVNLETLSGETPLTRAASNGNVNILHILLENGANV
jgi:ankyrin repeat protein